LIISDLHPQIQATMGSEHMELIEGEVRFFPTHHPHIEDYLTAVKQAGAELMAAIDIPMGTQQGLVAGALVVWAKKIP
jgi:hypothetical protein